MNAPFGARMGLVPWLDKFIAHGNGICLVPDRTSCPWFISWFPKMSLVLIVNGKLKFIDANGEPGKAPAQGTVLGAIVVGSPVIGVPTLAIASRDRAFSAFTTPASPAQRGLGLMFSYTNAGYDKSNGKIESVAASSSAIYILYWWWRKREVC
jgi:hypothetical protein